MPIEEVFLAAMGMPKFSPRDVGRLFHIGFRVELVSMWMLLAVVKQISLLRPIVARVQI